MKQPETAPRVVIMPSIIEAFLQMPYDEGNTLLRAIVLYQYSGITPELDGLAKLIWTAIFPTIETTRQITLGRSKGGKASKRNNPNGRRGKAAAEPEAPDGSPMNEEEAAPKPQRKALPDLDQIREYITVNNLNVDAEEFYNYYASRNWESNGQPIKSLAGLLKKWSEKATADTWKGQGASSIFNNLNPRHDGSY